MQAKRFNVTVINNSNSNKNIRCCVLFYFLQLLYYCINTVIMILYGKKCKHSKLKMVVQVLYTGCYDCLGVLITSF